MKFRIISPIIMLLCVTFSFAQVDRSKMPEPGPAPKINLGKPETFSLKNGLQVLVVENHKLPRVAMSLVVDNNPILEGDKVGVASLLSGVIGNGTTSMNKDAYNERIDFLGATVNIGSQSASAATLSKYYPEIMHLMADGVINPLFTQEEFNKTQKQLVEGIKSNEKSVPTAANRVTDALLFGIQNPKGEFVTAASVEKLTLDDVKKFYNTYFTPGNAYLVIVGDVNFKETKKLVKKNFDDWKKPVGPQEDYTVAKNPSTTEIDFVNMPNAVQSEIRVANNLDLKMSDPDYFAVLVANNILGGSFNSYLNMNLREAHGYTYGARSGVSTSQYKAGDFTASASVRNAVTDSAVVEFVKEIKRIRTEDVTDEALKNAKSLYAGSFVMALENPQTIARYALNIKTNHLPEDFYTTYLKNINAVTAADVKRVANKYFDINNSRIVVAGKGSEVLSGLEQLGYPVNYFDQYAKTIEKPEFKTPVPDGVTKQTVIDNYFKAIGGKDKVTAAKTVQLTFDGNVMGQEMQMVEKRTVNKIAQLSIVNNNVMGGVIITPEKAIMKQGANSMNLPETMKADMSNLTGTFIELSFLKNDKVKLDGIEKVNGKNAYKITYTGDVTTVSLYYDTTTGLKIKEEQTTTMGGRSQTQAATYSDYKEFNGILFPTVKKAAIMGQDLEFKLADVKINQGVTDTDFE
ncbi:insulinase family protein [Zhouia sp. PK063]|uniref:insulinase family protein n=1 Tax=Zhouia sp. PK063 TaxID=3373602 RepID=UPI00379821CD